MLHSLLLKTILEKANQIQKEYNYEYLCAAHIAIAVAEFCKTTYTGFCISDNQYPAVKYEEERLRYIFEKEVKLHSGFKLLLSKANRNGIKEEPFSVDTCNEIAEIRNSNVLSADVVFLCILKQYQEWVPSIARSDLSGNGVLTVLQETDKNIYDYVIEKIENISTILNEKAKKAAEIRDWKPAPKFAEPQKLEEIFFSKIEISTHFNVVILRIPHFFGKSSLKLSIYRVDDIYYIHDNGCAIKHLSERVQTKQKCEQILKKICNSCWIDKNKITGSFITVNQFLYYLQKLIFIAHADLYYTKAAKQLYVKEKGFIFPDVNRSEPFDITLLINELKKAIQFDYDENSGLYYWMDTGYSLFSMRASFLMESLENKQIRISDKRKGKGEGELFEAFYWDNDSIAPYGKFISKIASRFGAEFDGKDVYLTDKQDNFYTAIIKFFNMAIILSEFGHDIELPKLREKRIAKGERIMSDKKKLFVVSDIHGHYTLLKEALDKAGFDNDDENHLLVCCGDYFDRGNENVEVLKFFEKLKHKVLLRGNHEDLLLKVLQEGKLQQHNYINGTMITLENFFGKHCVDPVDDSIDFSGKNRTVDRICEFIKETINYFETENYVFVHGWFPEVASTPQKRTEVSDELWEKSRWRKWISEYTGKAPIEGKTMVCGHVPTFRTGKHDENRSDTDANIFYGNGLIAIDAGTFDSKQINVLVIEDKLINS